MSTISLSGIKYRAKSIGSHISDPSFEEFVLLTLAQARASISSPTIIAIQNRTKTSPPALAIASVVIPRLSSRTIRPIITNAIASVSTVSVRLSVAPAAATSTAANVSPVITSITSPAASSIASVSTIIINTNTKTIHHVIASATASVSTVAVTVSSGNNTLSFPVEFLDPLWAGNMSGQSYDDVNLVQNYIPTNDNVIGAIQITGTSGSVSGDTTGATSETANETTWTGGNPVPTIWYYWKNTTGIEQLFTLQFSSGYATFGGVSATEWPHHSGSVATGFDDLYPNGSDSRFAADSSLHGDYDKYGRIHVPDGEIIYIQIINYNNNINGFGPFSFNWSIMADAGPPANDDFANATVIAGSGSIQGTNEWATSDGPNDPLVSIEGYGPRSVWYKINSSGSSRSVTLSTSAGSSGIPMVDTVIGLYKGTTLAGLTLIAKDDDSGPGNYSLLTSQTLPAGETGYVEVVGYSDVDEASEGTFTLNWTIV